MGGIPLSELTNYKLRSLGKLLIPYSRFSRFDKTDIKDVRHAYFQKKCFVRSSRLRDFEKEALPKVSMFFLRICFVVWRIKNNE